MPDSKHEHGEHVKADIQPLARKRSRHYRKYLASTGLILEEHLQ